MKRFLITAVVVAALAAAGNARAQSVGNPDTVLTTIDAVLRHSDSRLYLTGVAKGSSAPEQVVLYGPSPSTSTSPLRPQALDFCERAALLLLTKPGMYELEVWKGSAGGYTYGSCRLKLVDP